MSTSPNLKRLRENREEILKAELFMLLHDVGKLHVGHQAKYVRDKKRGEYQHPLLGTPSNPGLDVLPDLDKISIQRKQFSFITIVKNHHRPSGYATRLAQQIDWLDSEYDREWVPSGPKYIQPISTNLSCYNAFGYAHKLLTVDLSRRDSCVDCTPPADFLEKLLCFVIKKLPLTEFPKNAIERKRIVDAIKFSFLKAAGDTRFSINEISLWDHSWSTAIMFKVFLSDVIIQNHPFLPLDGNIRSRKQAFRKWFRPQLLPLRIDGLAYLAQSNNVPDLLARRGLLQQVYDAWKDILEWEFPLAGEVYRDENGPVFLTFLRDQNGQHAITLDALQLPSDDEQEGQGNEGQNNEHVSTKAYEKASNLEEYLRQAIIYLTQGDLILPPQIELSTYTQKRSGEGKSLGDLLREEHEKGLYLQADMMHVANAWKQKSEICAVCGLRPVGYGANSSSKRQKAISRGMCGVCQERREERAKPWAQGVPLSNEERFLRGLPETIWLDEVADQNGRIALIVGYFPIEHWLDGSLIESLAMFKDKRRVQLDNRNRQITLPRNRKPVLGPKPVSYSRIRRVWETTRHFWQDVAPTDTPSKGLQNLLLDLQEKGYDLTLEDLWEGPLSLEESLAGQTIDEKRSRIFLRGSVKPKSQVFPYHAYELEIQGRKVAVLWVPEKDDDGDISEEYRGGFWVIENLDYLKSPQMFGRDLREILEEGGKYHVYEPSEYGRPGESTAIFELEKVLPEEESDDKITYLPLIPILAEPRTFMALVPAESAFDVLKAIKAKYEREMGKVRNRLPLHLGVVFADAHQPLRTILDAGRRMLKQRAQPLMWEVLCAARKQSDKGDTLPERFEVDKEGQFKEWYEVTLRHVDHQVTWYIPAVMGDGQTEDHWYPYVFLADCGEPSGRPDKRYYRSQNPWSSSHSWLIHAAALQRGDRVYFTPATFDFLWLDHGGRRFEIAYDDRGAATLRPYHRRGTLHRPYLLDELPNLKRCWTLLDQGLGARQIHQVRDLIETRRVQWFPDASSRSLSDPTFRRFCDAVLRNAEWQENAEAKQEANMQRLIQWAVDGTLADTVELFYHIMKRLRGDTENAGENP